jgi:hypothetical protein
MKRQNATLFRTFADVDYRDRTAILAFAKEYGLLGLEPQDEAVMVPEPSGSPRFHCAYGESHLDWAREICQMREALELTTSDTELEKARDRAAWGASGMEPPYDERRRKVEWLFNRHLQSVQPRIRYGAELPRLSFAPRTLLAAMWLQLALARIRDEEDRRCKFCKRHFLISTDPHRGSRSHREFCSDICKLHDYRKRKRTAVRMARKGQSAAAIAKEIDTATATVSRWLAASRRTVRT